ncbi:primosomal protein N' family DNA-binding protein [Sphaerisporangium sp. NPDC004334]
MTATSPAGEAIGAPPPGAAGDPARPGAARDAEPDGLWGETTPGKGAGTGVAKGTVAPAGELPIARVAVDVPLPHLDRPFDYVVPETMAEAAVPGCRVRVRFAGKLVDGFLLERAEASEHEGKLAALERVVSSEAVLTPQIAALCRSVADRYAGTMSDVLRLAVPPRHAKVEAEEAKREAARPVSPTSPSEGPGSPAGSAGGPADAPGAIRPVSPSGGAQAVGTGGPADAPGPSRQARAGQGAAAGPVVDGPAQEAQETLKAQGARSISAEPGEWAEYPLGASFLAAVAEGRAPRAVWSVLPGAAHGPRWAEGVALAVLAASRAGRGSLVVVPDGKDVALLDAALTRVLGQGAHVALTAGLGPAERYRRWLRVLRGGVRVAVGTRAAAFAPVHDLGLVAIWDDGDDLHAERLAPYPHAREVLALRAHQTGAAMLIAGYARTAEATRLIAGGWARPIAAPRETLRRHAPRVRPAGDDAEVARDEAARAARLPSSAWAALKQGLATGPVLVQVPRRGYLPALACQSCRAQARCHQPVATVTPPLTPDRPERPGSPRRPEDSGVSAIPGMPGTSDPAFPRTPGRPVNTGRPMDAGMPGNAGVPMNAGVPGNAGTPAHAGMAADTGTDRSGEPRGRDVAAVMCGGPLALRGGHAAPYCRWCGRIAGMWRCQACGSNRMRAVVVGARRTAEELGRAFPSVPVKTSGRDGVLSDVGPAPALVVATPGAEPVAEGGYAAGVLLDGWALLGRPDLRAAEEALRRWMNAAALLRPAAELVVLADSSVPAAQALIRWDPVTHAERELAERAVLGFPPAVRMATLTGTAAGLREMAGDLRLPGEAQVLGPVPVEGARSGPEEPQERLMVRVPRAAGPALARALKGAAGVRSARKAPDLVRVCMDPIDLI